MEVPPERVLSEAAALKLFRASAADVVLIPEVLFVDEPAAVLAMSDVGEGRQVLYSVIDVQFDLLTEQASQLGEAVGLIHGATRGVGSIRPAMEEALVRRIIFDGLLGPGALAIFPEHWPTLRAQMQENKECLVHGDLWSKNLLVRKGAPVALVDFEGVTYGDPAFDLATLICVALLACFGRPENVDDGLTFIHSFLNSWISHCGSEAWGREVATRLSAPVAVFLAARGFGPFAYPMKDAARESMRQLATGLASDPPRCVEALTQRVQASLVA
jgi:tRNA A-37 threonylcarbamoyl transferase component Bud32